MLSPQFQVSIATVPCTQPQTKVEERVSLPGDKSTRKFQEFVTYIVRA